MSLTSNVLQLADQFDESQSELAASEQNFLVQNNIYDLSKIAISLWNIFTSIGPYIHMMSRRTLSGTSRSSLSQSKDDSFFPLCVYYVYKYVIIYYFL